MTGLVFSYDEVATQYAILTEIQQPRVIESLQKMMVWALIPVSIDVQHMDLRFLRFETCAPHFFFSFILFYFILFYSFFLTILKKILQINWGPHNISPQWHVQLREQGKGSRQHHDIIGSQFTSEPIHQPVCSIYF